MGTASTIAGTPQYLGVPKVQTRFRSWSLKLLFWGWQLIVLLLVVVVVIALLRGAMIHMFEPAWKGTVVLDDRGVTYAGYYTISRFTDRLIAGMGWIAFIALVLALILHSIGRAFTARPIQQRGKAPSENA